MFCSFVCVCVLWKTRGRQAEVKKKKKKKTYLRMLSTVLLEDPKKKQMKAQGKNPEKADQESTHQSAY